MSMFSSLRLAGLAVLTLMLFASNGSAFEYRQIENWAVSCNNAYSCTISFNPPSSQSEGDELWAIQWHRSVDPNAPLTFSLSYPSDFLLKGDPKGMFKIDVDSVEGFSTDVSALSKNDALGTFGADDSLALMKLFKMMASGRVATISYSGNLGPLESTINLAGFAESARFIDQWQGREGRSDALIDPGEIAPPETSDIWPIDRYEQLPESVVRNLSDKNSECYTDEAHLEQADAFGFKGKSSTILLLPCNASGAYNQLYQIYVGNDESFHRSGFPNISGTGITVLDAVYNVNFDLKNKILKSIYLGRGLGDCGLAHYWDIDDDAVENPLILTQERSKSACDGESVGAENWPLTWHFSRNAGSGADTKP